MKPIWLNQKTVVLSGASSGIGRELVKELVNDYDCTIYGIGRNQKDMESLSLELKENKNRLFSFLFDVSKQENWHMFLQQLQARNVIPDILINNAGMLPPFSRFVPTKSNEIWKSSKIILNQGIMSFIITKSIYNLHLVSQFSPKK